MYRLRTFGGLVLERDGVPADEMASQRKVLAVLACLAVHGSLGRDRLMALLWPDSDAARARGSLKQAVHSLRRQLAEPELLLGTAELRLNPARIESDVQLFHESVQRGAHDEAVALYGGPFLDGVHLEGTSEFERWVDGHRDGYAARFHASLEALALAADSRGDAVAATEWWRRLQGADPLSSRVALRLMEALERGGDPAGALRHARAHELLLMEDLGLPPDPAVSLMAARLSAAVPRPAPTREDAATAPPAPARGAPPAATPATALAAPAAATPPATPSLLAWRRPAIPALMVLAMAGLLAAGVVLTNGRTASGLPAAAADEARASVAVLPLVDMSPDGDLEYLGDGIAEEILNTLAGIPGMRVPARTSSFHFRGSNQSVAEIAAALGVDHILEGSLRRDGHRIRVTAQLIEAGEDRHVWSRTFDSDFADVFAVQEEIARTVAEALRPRLNDGTRGLPRAVDPAAHDLYLRGLFHWNRRSAPDLLLAVRFFEEATALDPDYARPWAGMALAYAVIPIGFSPQLPVAEARARLERAAHRALALDPTLAEVHAARAFSYHFQWRWEDAEREYLRAIELDPRNATAHQWYGEHLAKTGRGAEAVQAMRRALELDPLSLAIRNDLGLVLMFHRQFDAARDAWEETLRMDPGFAIPHYLLHRLALTQGRLEEAEEWGRRWAELTNAAPAGEIQTLVRAVGSPALRPQAMTILRGWAAAPNPRWLDIAFYRTQLGAEDQAIAALESGLSAGAPMMVQIGHAPWVDPLRDQPRFQRLVRQLGFPE
jgi:TolB-like protein/DNA-binding SARP family transcriptional activator/Flp pilus assembly protein TadD